MYLGNLDRRDRGTAISDKAMCVPGVLASYEDESTAIEKLTAREIAMRCVNSGIRADGREWRDVLRRP